MVARLNLALGGEFSEEIRLDDHNVGALAVVDPLLDDRRWRKCKFDLVAGCLLESIAHGRQCGRERAVAQHLDGRRMRHAAKRNGSDRDYGACEMSQFALPAFCPR